METGINEFFDKIDEDIVNADAEIKQSKDRIQEVEIIIKGSEQEIEDSNSRFEGIGDQFL